MAEHPPDEWTEAANCLATVAHQLSSVVHEANNMLQVIAGSAEMIQLNAALPENVLKRSTLIAEQAHRVSSLLGAVRELSRFAPSRDGDTIDLLALVNGALEMRRHALNRAQIAVTVEGGVESPVVARASWRPVMQVVLNLMLNAEQAVAGAPDPRITLRLERIGDRAMLSVIDTGAGMAAEVHPYTLQPLTDDAPRLGLGLRASEWLAAREGGCLEVRSAETGTSAVLQLRAV